MKAFIAVAACLVSRLFDVVVKQLNPSEGVEILTKLIIFQAILPAISSANAFVQERQAENYPPIGNPLALFSYCTSQE